MSRNLFVVLLAIAGLILMIGLAAPSISSSTSSALAADGAGPQLVGQATVAGTIGYQGQLTSPGGTPLNGTYNMRFQLYDADVGGSQLWDSGAMNVNVADGLFNAQLNIDPSDFSGQALWLRIRVGGEWLSPRQQLLPAPYALSLRPGADIVGDSIGPTDAIVAGYAPATGTALYADANGGAGLFGDSENSYGVWGSSNDSWGGYFASTGGYGIRVDTNGPAHFDHGAYITSEGGYGIYAQSAENQAVRGEAGDVTGVAQPLGPVGVVGRGANRGTYGSSEFGTGLYGISNNNYGLWAQSIDWRGATGRTNRSDNNYGLYTPDNLFSLNYNLAGAMMQVVQNGSTASIEPGDVVVFSGMSAPVLEGGMPVAQVARTTQANSSAVAGVVYSRFNVDVLDEKRDVSTPDNDLVTVEVTPAGSVAPGEYLLLVVHGPAPVRTDAPSSDIQPGDLLATSSQNGLATKATTVELNGVTTPIPGTVFAKALGPAPDDPTMTYVFVTLQ